MYAKPHQHGHLVDHAFRVNATVAAAPSARAAADLSCGDGSVLRRLDAMRKIYGDLAPGYEHTGPIERTIGEIPDVDLFVCCETLEHLDNPAAVLAAVREKSTRLLLSTPVDAWGDANPEHYWAWGQEDVEELLGDAGWRVDTYTTSDHRPSGFQYCFGIWVCS
jgi:hypothetical protein